MVFGSIVGSDYYGMVPRNAYSYIGRIVYAFECLVGDTDFSPIRKLFRK